VAAAAAIAMMIGALTGLETGRVQFSAQSGPVLVAVDAGEAATSESEREEVHFYPPAYGLDHANLSAATSRTLVRESAGAIEYAVRTRGDYGLPGPGSPYLRSREILFLQ
jgi:hypothetical protein